MQAGSVRQVFVGHHDHVIRLATGGPPDAADAGGVECLRQLLEGETILAYTTGWLGRWRDQPVVVQRAGRPAPPASMDPATGLEPPDGRGESDPVARRARCVREPRPRGAAVVVMCGR